MKEQPNGKVLTLPTRPPAKTQGASPKHGQVLLFRPKSAVAVNGVRIALTNGAPMLTLETEQQLSVATQLSLGQPMRVEIFCEGDNVPLHGVVLWHNLGTVPAGRVSLIAPSEARLQRHLARHRLPSGKVTLREPKLLRVRVHDPRGSWTLSHDAGIAPAESVGR